MAPPSSDDPRRLLLSLSLKLSVRSRAPDGLILLLSDAKQMDFVVLKLTGGHLMLSADLGRGAASITSPVAVDDGHWHTVSPFCDLTRALKRITGFRLPCSALIGPFQVSAELGRRSLSLAVDTSKADLVSIKGNQLDVDKRLYLGGLPHAHATRRINVGQPSPAAANQSVGLLPNATSCP